MAARGGFGLALLVAATLVAPGRALAQDKPGQAPAKGPAKAVEGDLARLAEEVGPSVVGVSARRGNGSGRLGGTRMNEAAPAGVVVSADGLILTAAAVLPEDARSIQVTLPGGRRVKAREVRRDAQSGLVLIAVDEKGLKAATLADGSALKPGAFVATFGNPFGTITRDGQAAMAIGVVSAVDGLKLETDAAVNPGSFGGPLVDARGRVVGIVIPEYRNDRWLGMARALDAGAIALVEGARGGEEAFVADPAGPDGDEAGRGVVGIFIYEDDETEAGGAKIETVMPGSPAEKARLKPGDVVVSMNGKGVKSPADLAKRLRKVKAGDEITLKVTREEFEREVKLKADAHPDAAVEAAAMKPYLGIFAVNFSGRKGFGVDEVVTGSPAEKAGFKKGDAVLEINGKQVGRTEDLSKALEGKKPGDKLAFVVERTIDGEVWSKKITVELGKKKVEGGAAPAAEKQPPAGEKQPPAAEAKKKQPGYVGLYLKDVESGVLVEGVIPASPAEKAGLKTGDVIVSVSGEKATTIDAFTKGLGRFGAGDKVELGITREGGDWKKNVEVTLGTKPDRVPPPPAPGERTERPTPPTPPTPPAPPAPPANGEAKPGFLGVKVQEAAGGLEVVEVIAGSAAEKAGIKKGAVIAEVDGTSVASMAKFREVLTGRKVGDKLKIKYADGAAIEVTLTARP